MKKRVYLCIPVLLAVGVALWAALRPSGGMHEETPEETAQTAETTVTTSAESGTTTGTTKAAAPPYESPIDFTALQAENPDIYAWLEIPGTDISYPVVQREGDDAFYLHHNIEGEYEFSGAIYSESTYNSGDLSDPVTLLYGHQMLDGTMFSNLQQMYSDPESFVQYGTVVLYTPEAELDYQVFAAVPYDNRHILYTYDFTDAYMSNAFYDTIFGTRAIGAVFSEDQGPFDRVVILSTCLRGDKSKRYLVLAGLREQVSSAETTAELK